MSVTDVKPVSDWTQVYDNYDKAVVDFWRTFQYKSRPTLCVFASPERALAQVKYALREKGQPDDVIPLPFSSIDRVTEVYDHERYNTGQVRGCYRKRSKSYLISKKPQPVRLSYQIHLWSRNLREQDSIKSQVLQTLRANETYLRVFHPEPIGELICLTTLEGIVNSSTFDTGEKQRLLRRAYTFDVRGWVCYEPDEVKSVEAVNVDIIKSNDLVTEEEVIDNVEIVLIE